MARSVLACWRQHGKPVPCVLPGSSLGEAYVRPLRAKGCVTGLPPKGLLLLPFPWSGLVGLASPGGFGSGRSAPGAPLPGRWGSPLFLFCFSSVFPTLGLRWDRRVEQCGKPCWLKPLSIPFSASDEVDPSLSAFENLLEASAQLRQSQTTTLAW